MAGYLITGGCGFIGSHLADALVARGDSVRILDDLSTGHRANAPRQAEVIIGDVADAAAVNSAVEGMDGCFHLAAIASVPRSLEDWLGTHTVNLTGAIAVMEAARKRRLPVVYASSAAVYGRNPRTPLAEGDVAIPTSAYGADKLGCELHARIASHAHGVPTRGFRFFNVYGPRQDPHSPYSGVISAFCDRLLGGQPLTIHGDGEQVRDFVHVGDVVRHLLAGMADTAAGPTVFNVCTGSGTSILSLAHLLAALTGRRADIRFAPPRPGDIRTSVGDPAAAIRYYGLAAETRLADGLRLTLEGIRRAA